MKLKEKLGQTWTNLDKVAFVCARAFEWLTERGRMLPSPSVWGHLDPGDAMAVVPPSSPLQGSKLPPAKC